MLCTCGDKANPDLAVIWTVGQKMWQRDFPGTYENLKKEWSDGLQPIMDAVLGIVARFTAIACKHEILSVDSTVIVVVVVVNGSYSATPYSSSDRECITKVKIKHRQST